MFDRRFEWNHSTRILGLLAILLLFVVLPSAYANADESVKPPAETTIAGPDGLSIVVRMQGPYDAETSLQIVCYFARTETSDQRLFGAPVELDKRLGGVIAALRERGEFKGEALETFLLEPPTGTITPQRLLLIGLGDESDLSLQRMQQVGRTALREAVRIGAKKVAFAPLIKDAGNDQLPAGDVENAVVRGMLLAYDTEKRLQKEGFATDFTMNTWIVEAGPTYFDDTIAGVQTAVSQAAALVKQRKAAPYSTAK